MNRTLPFLVAVLVLLSGCFTVTPQSSESTTTAPVQTTTDRPLTGDELTPGVTGDGIVNPVKFMREHQRALLADGFVVDQTVTSTYQGAESNRLVMRTTAGPGAEIAYQNGSSYARDADGEAGVIHNRVWLNTTTMVVQHVEEGTATYQVRSRLYPPEYLIWFGNLQLDIQSAASEYEVASVTTEDGLRVVTLTAAIDRVGNDGVVDTNATIRVDERGVIRHAETFVTYDEGTTYHTTYTVRELGVAPPAPPAWVETVPPSAALEIGLDVFDFDGTTIELVHVHGDAVPANSTVVVTTDGSTYQTTLGEPFGDGTRYLWVGGDGTLRATADRPAASAETAFGTEVTVTVVAPDGAELFSTSVGRN